MEPTEPKKKRNAETLERERAAERREHDAAHG